MPIDAARISNDIETIASFSECDVSIGHSRPTFSASWTRARDYVIAQARAIGCIHRIDAAGNVHIRSESLPSDAIVWLSGSHIDSVPTGGKYDGVVGIICALEVLRAAHESGRRDLPLELIIFAEEEGTTFGLGLLGSRAWVGSLDAGQLSAGRNAIGQNYLEAGAALGVRPDHLEAERLSDGTYFGFVEVHIEQAPAMWNAGVPLAVVTAIAGRRQYRCTITGVANHAGSTSMSDRKDALVGAATCMLQLEGIANGLGGGTVLTVGRIECKPNAINVIPSEVTFTIDFRSPSDVLLHAGEEKIRHVIQQTCCRRGLSHTIDVTENAPPINMNALLCDRLEKAANTLGISAPRTVSGALHDAAILAPIIPTAMLFVASKDGISHNPAEFSRAEDIAAAARVLYEVVSSTGKLDEGLQLNAADETRPASGAAKQMQGAARNRGQILSAGTTKVTLAPLNAADRAGFVAVCGPLFEHSPWVAERTWDHSPFASRDALHAALCETMYAASRDEQVQLIASHPDLVGTMARQGRLTRESTTEQAAAGLDTLTNDEIETFSRYNAKYQEKFGFPFVICARQSKKEAILAAFPKRLANTPDEEFKTALEE
nr:2-oxo-4-hydroxy-4-carboxy-5-ureidoimidazoline decarboxylase [Chthoniobacterales bacterium]